MTYKVIIGSQNGKFPLKGLNELLNGRLYNFRTKKYHNSVKSENDKVCRLAIQKYMRGVKIDKPIRCTYYIYAQDKRHDRNNLESATTKSFLDALQQCGCIKSDGFDYVLDSVFHSDVCQENPRIEVIIEEVEGE